MIDVIIVDDQQIVREGLNMILSLSQDINIVGEACNGKELLDFLLKNTCDIILMDIRMPVMNGIEATKIVKEKYPDIKIIILTTFNEDEYIFDGLKNGANGYILKDSGSKELISAIRNAMEGNMLLNPKVTLKVVDALNSMNRTIQAKPNEFLNELTPREREVAELAARGKSNKDIAQALFVTEGTVKNYMSKILEKLQMKSRSELILFMNSL